MRAYLEIFDSPGGIIRLTNDDALTHGKRTPYFRAFPVQIIKSGPQAVLGMYGIFTSDGKKVLSDEERGALMRCLYEEHYAYAEWERWQDGKFRKVSRAKIHA